MNRRGFTITELLIVIVIMGILLTLGVVNLRGSQVNSRDSERKSDIDALALHLESYYSNGNDSTTTPFTATGGTITTSGGYTMHTFTSTGQTFTPNIAGNVEILVVAGGGGGGGSTGSYGGGAGGGAGGYVYNASLALTGQAYTVVVGGGGGGASNTGGSSGSNSSFSTLTAIGGGGGGGGGSAGSTTGLIGGSGGGAGYNGYALSTVGAGTGGQGYAGGQNGATSWAGGGGGGGSNGAGGVGQVNHVGGLAGVGTPSSISGVSVTYSTGGAGAGSSDTTTVNAINNTGNGGNGIYGTTTISGSGGSGIVIIRYLTPGTNTAHTTTYPSTALTTAVTIDSVHTFLRDIDLKAITAPGITDPAITLISATNTTQTAAGVRPQPTFDQYVYQPLKSDGSLCTSNAQECVEFNLYYQLEADKTVYMVMSRHQ